MKIFISGIDTDSGKSVVTGLIAKYLLDNNQSVITQKLVQTGCEDMADDILTHRQICAVPLYDEDKEHLTCSYLFKHPASPHLSAAMEGVEIDVEQFTKDTKSLEKRFDNILIEGAGGLMVPLNGTYTSFDYIRSQNYPLVLVSSSKLGSINHTLLSLELLKQYGVNLKALVYNQYPNQDPAITQDTEQVLAKCLKMYYPDCPFLSIPEINLEKAENIDFSSIFA